MKARMSPYAPDAVAHRASTKGRFLGPLLFLFGMAVPVALGAARVEKPLAGTYAKVGLDSRFPNALVCQHKGELIILTYEESAAPIKHGMVSFSGTIHAVPLREALKDYLHAQENQESEQTPPPADSESNSGHK